LRLREVGINLSEEGIAELSNTPNAIWVREHRERKRASQVATLQGLIQQLKFKLSDPIPLKRYKPVDIGEMKKPVAACGRLPVAVVQAADAVAVVCIKITDSSHIQG